MAHTMTKAAALLGAALLLAGCGGSHQSAPDPGNAVGGASPGTNAHVIQEPEGFRNVAFSCFGHNGVYVTSRGAIDSSSGPGLTSSVFVVSEDEHCR